MSDSHSVASTLREKIIEHLFVGELLRYLWCLGRTDIDVLRPEVDRGGYDISMSCNGVVRHIQLKASYKEARTPKVNVNKSLADRVGGCVIWIRFNQKTLELGPYYWFGGYGTAPMPDLGTRIARHTRASSSGKRAARPMIRELTKSRFSKMNSIEQVADKLFGIAPPAA